MGITLSLHKAHQWKADSAFLCFLSVILVFTTAQAVVLKCCLVFHTQEGWDVPDGENVCWISCVQAGVIGLLAVNSMLMNQQYILNKVF